MPFNSYDFLFMFLPLVVAGFWCLARVAGRDIAVLWIVLASVVFYFYAGGRGLVVLAPSILLDYLIASALLRTPQRQARLRSICFVAGITCNIAFLAYFKYKNFFVDTANNVFGTHFHLAKLMLPLGISFLTFQKIAFLSDVGAGSIDKVRFLDYLFFTTFFPRSIAGPIIRYNEVMPQLERSIPLGEVSTHLSVGLVLFSIGLFKKAFIADQLAPYVSTVFDLGPVIVWDPGTPTLLTSWTAVLAYTFELYFDFSGYSDMALGVARMLGVRLPMNFNSPFKASSIVEFWARWHITLTRFLTAYIYTPLVLVITRARLANGRPILAGSRSGLPAVLMMVAAPTLATMTISGIWHGAGWQFVLWGMLHGIYLTINQSWRLVRAHLWRDTASYTRVMRPVGVMLTFAAVVLAQVFFRAKSVPDALSILYAMVGGNGLIPDDVKVLEQLGVRVPSDIVGVFLPVTPWIWFGVLFGWVMLLPNSLELLRMYLPAMDYQNDASERGDLSGAASMSSGVWAKMRTGLRGSYGISLNALTAAAAAVLCLMGVLMLSRGETFIYWNF